MTLMAAARPLTAAELLALAGEVAAEVRAGVHPVGADPRERWHVRLRSDDQVDVWLISWTTEQGTELHDHGGSSGAFTVVEGELTETVWRRGPADLVRAAGETVSFDAGYVHDVRNHAATTAVSVHVYSPPLQLMHYYDQAEGRLVRRASSWTDDPEAPSPARATKEQRA